MSVAHEIKHDWSKEYPGYAHGQKCRSPVDPGRKIGADQSACCEPKRDPEREHRERAGAAFRREIVRDKCIGRCDAASFPHTHAKPVEKQLPEPGGRSAQCGEGAPDRKGAGDDPAPAGSVGEQRERNAKGRIENREGKAGNGAELRIRELQIGNDGASQNAEDLAVQEVEDVREQKQRQEDTGMRPLPSRSCRSAQKLIPTDRNTCRGAP